MTDDATLRHTSYSLLVLSSQLRLKNRDTPQITAINPLLLKIYCNPINALLDNFCYYVNFRFNLYSKYD